VIANIHHPTKVLDAKQCPCYSSLSGIHDNGVFRKCWFHNTYNYG